MYTRSDSLRNVSALRKSSKYTKPKGTPVFVNVSLMLSTIPHRENWIHNSSMMSSSEELVG
ncbi:hypothetical protein DSO57_1023227 [Entomophthora muscae]|uniref:Uncharacterized protein n=1 Tax=Entomophthora muscae TaxID=34485 RepID=A0ACC2UCU9_9FUNG|nr:hypothetical protein DSO57_1023227 [Entomophthora muscae]